MAFRQIIPYTDPRMKLPSAPVEAITPEIKALADDMIATMVAVDGAGLAAIQVGEPWRLFVMIDLPGSNTLPNRQLLAYARRLVLINPKVVAHSEEIMQVPEGCLSMPGVFFPVKRWQAVTLEFTNILGQQETITGSGYKAVCLQHELDHLDGIRNIDRVSRFERERAVKKFKDNLRRQRAA